MSSRVHLSGSQVTATVVIIIVGLIFHELYKSTGVTFLGIIAPVNESKWEHWKIAFFPMLIIGIIEYFIVKSGSSNHIFSLVMGLIVFQVITFGGIELYEILFSESHFLVHFISYMLGAVGGQIVRYKVMEADKSGDFLALLGMVVIIVQVFFFYRYTFDPPRTDYFMDSISKTYGIYEEKQ